MPVPVPVPVAALALALAVAPPDAPAAALQWTWEAPAGCPDAATTRRELGEATRDACGIAAEARVAATQGGYRLDLQVRARAGADARTLTAGSCRALADAAIVIVAVACSEDAAGGEPPAAEPLPEARPAAEPLPEAPSPPAVPEVLAPSPAAEPPPEAAPAVPGDGEAPAPRPGPPRPIVELGLRGGAAWAPTLAPTAMGALALRLRWPWVDLVATAGGASARDDRYPEEPELGVAHRLVHGGLAACPSRTWGRGRGRGRGGLCGGLEVGAMIASGIGAPVNRTRARPWAAVSLGPALGWIPHPRIALGLEVDLLVALVRPAFGLEGREPRVEVASLGVRLHTSLLLRLW